MSCVVPNIPPAEEDLVEIPPNSCTPVTFKELAPEKFNAAWYLKHVAPKLDAFLSSLETREQQVYGHIDPNAKLKHIHPHQKVRNVPKAFPEVYEVLKDFVPTRSNLTFEELYNEIDAIIRPIKYIGELAVYDITLRVGWNLPNPIRPETLVYLHRGAKTGAELLLGRKIKERYIPYEEIKELVVPLTKSHHIEDFLCLYHMKNN